MNLPVKCIPVSGIITLMLYCFMHASAQQWERHVVISGGINQQLSSRDGNHATTEGQVDRLVDFTPGRGGFGGLDVKIINSKSRVGINLGACFQAYNTQNETYQAPNGNRRFAWYRIGTNTFSAMQLRAGATYVPQPLWNSITLSGTVGLEHNMMGNYSGFRNFLALYPQVAVGYKGIMLMASYSHGLSPFIEPDNNPEELKSRLLNVGLSLDPYYLLSRNSKASLKETLPTKAL